MAKNAKVSNRPARSMSGATGPGLDGTGSRKSADEVKVLMVSVVEAAAPLGVTVVGEKLHDAPAGRSEQESPTASLNPFEGVTVTVVVPDWPAVTLSVPGEALSAKSGAPVAMPEKETVCGLPVALSAMETEAVRVPTAVGVKVTLMVQLAPTATLEPHVLVWL
jgi:hypothetical protein